MLTNWLLAGSILLALAVIALPVFNSTAVKGAQTKSLAQAKQIALALKVYAGDHDDNYPQAGQSDLLGAKPQNSNAAFAVLFPRYLTTEKIFGNELSAYQTRPPDDLYDARYTGHPQKTLAPGENVYAYMAGLNEAFAPGTPLVADGTDGTGHYTTDRTRRGGVWEGAKAIVIRLDNSGYLETTVGPDNARYVPRRGADPKVGSNNLLDATLYGKNAKLLDPAVDPAGEKR